MLVEEFSDVLSILTEISNPKCSANFSDLTFREQTLWLLLLRKSPAYPSTFPPTLKYKQHVHHIYEDRMVGSVKGGRQI